MLGLVGNGEGLRKVGCDADRKKFEGKRVKIESSNMILFLEPVVLNDNSFLVSDQNTL